MRYFWQEHRSGLTHVDSDTVFKFGPLSQRKNNCVVVLQMVHKSGVWDCEMEPQLACEPQQQNET